MEISFDPEKREKTLRERGLDFADAPIVFAGPSRTLVDERFDYPERRFTTFGLLDDRMVVLIWTVTDRGCRIISMRKANEREQARHRQHLD